MLGVVVGYVTNWVALWMIYEPAEPRRYGPLKWQGLFVRRQREVADVYASIVADEILTVAEFGNELLHGPRSDRTRALIESAMRPGDRPRRRTAARRRSGSRSARASTTRSASRSPPSRSSR